MIELVTTAGTTTMNVWSPLSSSPTTTSACSGGGTFSATNPFITGIPLPSDGVVYVQSYQPTGGIAPTVLPTAPAWAATNPTQCFNPYLYSDSPSRPQCYEGDVYIEGELHGQLTVASAANIIITRDLTYYCVDASRGAPSSTDPSSVSACTSSATPDILGLSAEGEVLISANDPAQTPSSDSLCTYDGTGTPPSSGCHHQRQALLDIDDPQASGPGCATPAPRRPAVRASPASSSTLPSSPSEARSGSRTGTRHRIRAGRNLEGTDLSEFRGPFGT